MPWNVLSDLLHSPMKATLQGLDERERSLMVELQDAVPQNHLARLTFPCGGTLSGTPVWQRRPGRGSGSVVAAFQLPDLCEQTWKKLEVGRPDAVRDEPRTPLRLWVSFPKEQRGGAVTADLSLNGCRVEADLSDRVGQTMALYLDLPDQSAPALLKARVVWSRGGESGLQFVNLTTCAELRILRILGRATVPPSSFLPQHPLTAPSFTYRLTQEESRVQLELSITNWDVRFEFEEVRLAGSHRGAFESLEVLESSSELRELRARLGIDLSERREFAHLRLLGSEGQTVLELLGLEVGFQRVPRSRSAGCEQEVPG